MCLATLIDATLREGARDRSVGWKHQWSLRAAGSQASRASNHQAFRRVDRATRLVCRAHALFCLAGSRTAYFRSRDTMFSRRVMAARRGSLPIPALNQSHDLITIERFDCKLIESRLFGSNSVFWLAVSS